MKAYVCLLSLAVICFYNCVLSMKYILRPKKQFLQPLPTLLSVK